jgi:hypothetical protein
LPTLPLFTLNNLGARATVFDRHFRHKIPRLKNNNRGGSPDDARH